MILETMLEQLTVSDQQVNRLAEKFSAEMKEGLAGRASSLKMLPSYIDRPQGEVIGQFVAVDFGGTNIRVLLVELKGQGSVDIKSKKTFSLRDDKGRDYTTAKTSGQELFEYMAKQIALITEPTHSYAMGHTFSFPCQQLAVDSAKLLFWTKEIKTCGVEGQDVGALFAQAFVNAGVDNIKQVAIINDTVGTLLAAAYNYDNVDIGSICGTGHNTCYREFNPPIGDKPMIINMESGNFDKLGQTEWDVWLDEQSDSPGRQRLEKMCSGHYIGQLLAIIYVDYLQKNDKLLLGRIEAIERLKMDGANLSMMLSDQTFAADHVRDFLRDSWGTEIVDKLNEEDYRAMRKLAKALETRSARLIAATYLGTLRHIDPQLQQPHTLAIDGSLYEKLPGFSADMEEAIRDNTPESNKSIRLILAKDGSGVGAAIAAAAATTV